VLAVRWLRASSKQ